MIRYRTEIERFSMILGLSSHARPGMKKEASFPQREILPAKRKTNPAVSKSF